jgi:endopeptidase La
MKKSVNNDDDSTDENTLIVINNHLDTLSQDEIKCLIADINKYIKMNDLHSSKITLTVNKHKKTHQEKISDIMKFVEENQTNNEIIKMFNIDLKHKSTNGLLVGIKELETKYSEINSYMSDIKNTLNDAIHGHNRAKTQIERIIGQWINGKQDGYCFGFEGPAGVGKTTLAKKGLAKCLKDENGVPRPFAMIQMGGDTNGSSLHGHNYTYVGSSWGSIVQILMDKKCMNPIIFIDEIDKISRTESGKEIIGILTHLLDPAQNDCFQDKYFSGIDLDLSKALFILSYNDVELIDKIMLDRIHRIKFENLSLEEKITISNTYLLPEIYEKMGLKGMINLNKDVLKYIINEYTLESGVRKLKEILFEIVAEINLDILKNMNADYEIPINISIDDITNKYFKEKREIKYSKIHSENKIGIINGLWANSFGVGGVLLVQAKWTPSEKFMGLHLTGMQGDVMKESMNVALTLAWNLTPFKIKEEIQECEKNGIHVHCPEGATPKDGPSAGAAITVAIYSLMNKLKIKSNIAITGEITLDGNITEIGGLELKILGGIKAGVTEFIYPKENEKDFDDFQKKYKSQLTNNILFHSVDKIDQVFQLMFE